MNPPTPRFPLRSLPVRNHSSSSEPSPADERTFLFSLPYPPFPPYDALSAITPLFYKRGRMDWGARQRITFLLAVTALAPPLAFAQTLPSDPAAKKIAGAEGLLARGQYDLARQEYDEFLQQFPHDSRLAQARYERAVAEFNLHDLPAARADLTAAVTDTSFAKRDEALSLLGTIALQQSQPTAALAALDQLLHDYPQSPQVESAQVNRAQAFFRLSRFDDSLNAVRALLKAFPSTGYRASALYVGALDQRQLGDEKEAERTLREIVTAYPNSPFVDDAQLLIGETLAAQGRGDEAIAHYRQLETLAPESHKPAVKFGLAVALLGRGQTPPMPKAHSTISSKPIPPAPTPPRPRCNAPSPN